MIKSVTTPTVSSIPGLNNVLKACNCKTLALARDHLFSQKMGLEELREVSIQTYTMLQTESVDRLLILFLQKINDQDSIDTLCPKLLPLYHKSIADARKQSDYKILNYLSCEYCQFVAQYCTDIKEIETALEIQEDLLDDINFGINVIDNTVYADPYEEQVCRQILLIAKFHQINLNSDESTSDLMASLASKLFSLVSKKISKDKLLIANYHLAFLMMRVDNLDLFNLQQAYKILKTLLKEELSEPFVLKIKFRLAELIRQAQNEDIGKDENGFNEMRKLYFEIIFADDKNRLKAKAQYSLSQIFDRHEFSHGVDLVLCRSLLKQVILNTAPSSVLYILACYQFGEFQFLGTSKDDANPVKGKEYFKIAIQSSLLNEYILLKLNSLCKMKTEGKAHIEKAKTVEVAVPTVTELNEIRKILVLGIDCCVENSYYKMHNFYRDNFKFCMKNKNFNAEIFRNLGPDLSQLERVNFTESGVIFMSENCLKVFKNQLIESVLPNLYAADRLSNENPFLSFQLYQINLSIIFALVTFQRALISQNMVNKCYQEPKYLCASDDIKEVNGHFYKDYRALHGQDNFTGLFEILTFPQNLGIFREMVSRTNVWIYNLIKKDKFYEINPTRKNVNGFQLQPFKIPSKEMHAITIAKTWALLKKLPLKPEYRPGIIQTISVLRYQLLKLNLQTISISGSKSSQEELLLNIHLSKLLYDFDRKIKHSVDPMDGISLNANLLDLVGILPKFNKFSLILDIARFNRDRFMNVVYISDLQMTNSFYLAISGYLKAFRLHPSTRIKIEILEELFSFGPQSGNDYVKLIQSLDNIEEDERKDCEVSVALLISCRIEYLLFLNQASLAEELIDEIKNSRFYFENNRDLFDLLNKDALKIVTKTEGLFTFQLYAHDLNKREKVLSKIGPYYPAEINFEFEIPAKSLKKNKPTIQPQQLKSQKKKQNSPLMNITQRVPENKPVEIDPFEHYDTSSNAPSVTSMSKKAASEQLQKIENKKLLKEQRANANTNSSSEIPAQKIDLKNIRSALLPIIIISKDAKDIFDKLWIPHKGAINLESVELDAKNYKSDSLLTKDEVVFLVTALGGSYESGHGSHEKCILGSIDHADKIIIKGEIIHLSNFASIERATMPLPKEKKSGKDFLDGFLIHQFRSKLIQLGYIPLTVKIKDEV